MTRGAHNRVRHARAVPASASARQRNVQPGIVGVMTWRRMRRRVAAAGALIVIAMCAAVAR